MDEITEALRALEIAENHFAEATGEFAEIAVLEVKVAMERYNAAIRWEKQLEGGS